MAIHITKPDGLSLFTTYQFHLRNVLSPLLNQMCHIVRHTN